MPATKENVAMFEARRAELEAAANESLTLAEGRAESIQGLGVITIEANAGEEGKLFGSIGTRDIADAVTAAGVEINKSEVRLPEGPFRMWAVRGGNRWIWSARAGDTDVVLRPEVAPLTFDKPVSGR